MSNPLMNLTEIELRDLCRHHIDSFESWSWRLIDEIFREHYGNDYFNGTHLEDGEPLIKAEIRRRVEDRMRDNYNRYPRKIDAILIEDVEYFLCKENFYADHFKEVLEPFYSGRTEIRQVLERLISIRNKLSHGNTISIHEAEQCICYSNDFIEVYKKYYSDRGKEKDYNVPVIIRMKDCLGNDFVRNDARYEWHPFCNGAPLVGGGRFPKVQLRSGDIYKLWVEVDSSFDRLSYDISWTVTQGCTELIKKGTGTIVDFTVSDRNVSYYPEIRIQLKTQKAWHRFQTIDDLVEMHLMDVLPSIEDTY